ncbi:YtxH domain-containing protein [Cohnella rhizosphaerae]|uniref:YtxH domain-containing protein n=1 Tax=Cohnella rhizosphaerae TaxID=1457232 RepID=A0A9X4QTX9_9BACL|nr:YtxH domain-containing protein [Cohnella rhizosphaerae]MDG0810853.1 YtxH domain-containing protein [Cohnella rhizosphaerae]
MAGMVKGVVIGGVVGAAAALLLAPKPGKETRQDLMNAYSKSMDKSKEWASTAGSKTQELASKVGQSASDMISQTKSVLSNAKDGMNTAKDDITSSLQESTKPN